MKKITLMALAGAMFMGSAVANAQQVDETGYLFNRFQDNWFVEGLGGAGVMMSKYDANAKLGDRIGWKGNLEVGKWFSPVMGLRIGGEFNQMKGAYKVGSEGTVIGARPGVAADKAGFNLQQFNNIGLTGDAMFNLTNLFCGYKPGRFYNAVAYAGAGIHWVYERELDARANLKDWVYAGGGDHARNLSLRAGLLNTFRLSEHVNLLLDLRFEEMQEHVDGYNKTWNEYPSALLGLSYKFNKTEWNAPVIPVCPEVPTYKYTDEEGDRLAAQLRAAKAKVEDLENQLKGCNKGTHVDPTPAPTPAVDKDAPLAIIYYPINVSKIVGVQNNVVDAVANVMLEETSNYELTGWADNYTGNDVINTRLRKDRVAGVKAALVGKGVEADRLNTQINDGNRTNFGPKCASLDRAVTIERAK
ncbi:MAG: hypothetical protein MJZ74_05220 [Muribaculaceae bacterium]|nr:hypothetical protein [Muribaculaceae bacterium]